MSGLPALPLEDPDGHGFHWCSDVGPEICKDDGTPAATAGAPPEPKQPKNGFWQKLGHGLSNWFHGHPWNYETRYSVTIRIAPAGPIPAVKAATDVGNIVFAITRNTRLGYVAAGASVANDPSPVNIGSNAVGLFPETALPAAFLAGESDLLTVEVQTTMKGMLETIPGKTMDDGFGHSIPNPAEMDVCDELGGSGC